MIYDPERTDMALREDLTLMWRTTLTGEADGKEVGQVEQWVPLDELKRPGNPDDFTRPLW
jgi:hypothetical protein